jgi:hypothetical protein
VQSFRPEVAARLGDLAPLLLDELDAMTDRMVEVLLRSEPAYGDLLEAGAAEFREAVRANLELGVTSLIGAASGTGRASLSGAREVGRRRAAQGIPLEAVLRAYRLGGQITWETLLAVSRAGGHQHDALLLEVAGSVWRTNDAECSAVAEAYREEQHRLDGVGDEARQQVLDGLLDGRGGDPAFVRNASARLAVPLTGRLVVVVALPEPDGDVPDAPCAALLRRGVRSVWGTRSGARVGVVALGALPVGDVLAWLRTETCGPVGVSSVVDDAAAVGCAYRLAETAARTLPAGAPRVVTIDERLPEALLSNSPEISSRLVGQTLGGLLALPEEERAVLLDTLAAFLASDGSPTRAADELYCHRNTVMHRLRRIESVTGRKLTDPRSRLLWQLALLDAEGELAGTRLTRRSA